MSSDLYMHLHCLHVDVLFSCAGDKGFDATHVVASKDYFPTEHTNDLMCVGQRVCWVKQKTEQYIRVDQDNGIEQLGKIEFARKRADTEYCNPAMHSQYIRALGQVTWLQSRTHYQACYRFLQCESA